MYKIAQKLFAVLTTVAMLAAFPFAAFANHSADNPDLPRSCGLDVVLVMDRSGSIGSDISDMQSAFKDFVDALMPNDTEMSLVSFAGSASLDQDWTASATDMKIAIDAVSVGGATNWVDALDTAHAQFPHRSNPDLIVFASDGNPNTGGSVENAVTEANEAKADGIRIETIAIGNNLDTDNLEDISSADAVHTADFDTLADELAALADAVCDQPEGDDTVVNNNEAWVENGVFAGANTGGNSAGGSTGGAGGDGGDISNPGDDVEGSQTGNGGRGGNAGGGEEQNGGGAIVTGDATAGAVVVNKVNTNRTVIDRCACNGDENGDTRVRNENSAHVGNLAGSLANSGLNGAEGSRGGAGGDGGDISNSGDDVEDSTTGNGGAGGSAGPGGFVMTGNAGALTIVENVINTNITRIRR